MRDFVPTMMETQMKREIEAMMTTKVAIHRFIVPGTHFILALGENLFFISSEVSH